METGLSLMLSAAALPLALVMALSDRLMMVSFGNYFIYNKSWEDPRVESELLKIGPNDHVLTIASAGDNVLHYAVLGARVTAVDLNECQLALTELKMVAADQLRYEDFWAIFGECRGAALRAHYAALRPHLSAGARAFWDRKAPAIGSLMYSGSSGMLAWFVFRALLPLAGFGWLRRAVLARTAPADFRALCDKHVWALRRLCWAVDALMVQFGAALAGVPAKQLELMGDRSNSMAVVAYKIFYETDFCTDNYFFAGYVRGFYTHESCPDYLKPENFERLRRAVRAGNIRLRHQSLADACAAARAEREQFTVASLLDHMDWLEHVHINDELSLLFEVMPQNAPIFYRTFSDTVHSPPLMWQEPERVDLHALRDRVPMYFSAFVIRVDQSRAPQARCESWQAALAAPNKVGHHSANLEAHAFATGPVEKLRVGAQLVLFPIRKRLLELAQRFGLVRGDAEAHAQRMEEFYASQADAYDAFRERFLWARAPLAASLPIIPLKKGEERVWIDIGGGTGRNLEFVPPEVLRKSFTKIVVFDISASLLKVAERRVKANGLESLVECVCGDVNDLDFVSKHLPAQADIVTFSYSLSMIPDKQSALRTARRLLAPQGVLAIADFFYDSADRNASPLRAAEAALQAAWFRQDGVHLLRAADVGGLFRAAQAGARTLEALDCVWVERFRGAVPLLPILRPYHGVLVAQLDSSLVI